MTGIEVKKKIEENNTKIEQILIKESFQLNLDIVGLMNENDELRKQCPHEDDGTGICKYCLAEIGD